MQYQLQLIPVGIPDRDFCNWFAGFFDGEGHLHLSIHKRRNVKFSRGMQVNAGIVLGLRLDDLAIMEEIHATIGCGNLWKRPASGNSNPQIWYSCRNTIHLVEKIIPMFDKYPLRAKKGLEYAPWKQAVYILYEGQQRKIRTYFSEERYSDSQWEEIVRLADEIKEIRRYKSP